MLGYVQSGDERTWAGKSEQLLTAAATDSTTMRKSTREPAPALTPLYWTQRRYHEETAALLREQRGVAVVGAGFGRAGQAANLVPNVMPTSCPIPFFPLSTANGSWFVAVRSWSREQSRLRTKNRSARAMVPASLTHRVTIALFAGALLSQIIERTIWC